MSRRRRRYVNCSDTWIKETVLTSEMQMADLKENIEDEIHSAHDQYLKMDSHVKLYMNEIEHLM